MTALPATGSMLGQHHGPRQGRRGRRRDGWPGCARSRRSTCSSPRRTRTPTWSRWSAAATRRWAGSRQPDLDETAPGARRAAVDQGVLAAGRPAHRHRAGRRGRAGGDRGGAGPDRAARRGPDDEAGRTPSGVSPLPALSGQAIALVSDPVVERLLARGAVPVRRRTAAGRAAAAGRAGDDHRRGTERQPDDRARPAAPLGPLRRVRGRARRRRRPDPLAHRGGRAAGRGQHRAGRPRPAGLPGRAPAGTRSAAAQISDPRHRPGRGGRLPHRAGQRERPRGARPVRGRGAAGRARRPGGRRGRGRAGVREPRCCADRRAARRGDDELVGHRRLHAGLLGQPAAGHPGKPADRAGQRPDQADHAGRLRASGTPACSRCRRAASGRSRCWRPCSGPGMFAVKGQAPRRTGARWATRHACRCGPPRTAGWPSASPGWHSGARRRPWWSGWCRRLRARGATRPRCAPAARRTGGRP